MGYDADNAMVRVDIFKKSGKWYTTIAINWQEWSGDSLIHNIFQESLTASGSFPNPDREFFAVCLEPYHEHSHPLVCWSW